MNDLYLTTVTLTGLHYKRTGKGGGYSSPLPFEPEAGAYRPKWDSETNTITYIVPQPDIDGIAQDPIEMQATITPGEIAAGAAYIASNSGPRAPAQVSPLQIRKALRNAGLKDTIDAAIDAATEETREAWEYATYISRTDPMLTAFTAAIGWDESQTDQLFIDASKL